MKQWYMTSHGKKIHQCKSSSVAVVERITLTLPKSHTVTWPRLSFSLNPSIRPSLSQQHLHSILTLNLSVYPLRPFPLLSCPVSRYLMFLSTLLIPNLHSIQAGGFQWGGDKTSSEDCACPHKHRVLFELLCHKGCFSQRRKRKRTLAGLQRRRAG